MFFSTKKKGKARTLLFVFRQKLAIETVNFRPVFRQKKYSSLRCLHVLQQQNLPDSAIHSRVRSCGGKESPPPHDSPHELTYISTNRPLSHPIPASSYRRQKKTRWQTADDRQNQRLYISLTQKVVGLIAVDSKVVNSKANDSQVVQ